jgi:hypothetical protein
MYPTPQTEILANDLKKKNKLNDYEALDIATKIMQNELYARTNVLDNKIHEKSALEEIAIVLNEISEKLDFLSVTINKEDE